MAAEEGTLSVMLDKVSFVTHVPLLLKATADDESPTPGYMYKEICDLSLASGSYCLTLLDYLVDRLDKESYHVKLKVLRILHFIIQNGHPDFRQGLRRRPVGVQAATQYSGPPDPLHGNTPYLMVRKAAQDLSQLLFDVNTDDAKVPEVRPTAIKNQGGMGNSSTLPGKMQGFGNTPNIPNKSLGDTIISGIKDFAAQVVDPEDPRWSVARASADHFRRGQYAPVSLGTAPGIVSAPGESIPEWERSPAMVSSNRVKKVSAPVHRPGVAGGGWEDDPQTLELARPASSDTASSESRHTPVNSTSSVNRDISDNDDKFTSIPGDLNETFPKSDGSAVENKRTEMELVNGVIYLPTKGIPSRDDVNNFIKRCGDVNAEQVLYCLNDHLSERNEPQTFRSLLLLDFLMKTDLVTVDHIINVFASNLVSVYLQTDGPTKSKARKIIRQLEALTGTNKFVGMPKPVNNHGNVLVSGEGSGSPKTNNTEDAEPSGVITDKVLSTKVIIKSDVNLRPLEKPEQLLPSDPEYSSSLKENDLMERLLTDSSPEWSSLKVPFGVGNQSFSKTS